MQHYKTIDLLGDSSILFNPGESANFIYSLIGDITKEDMHEVNSLDGTEKLSARMKTIKKKGLSLQFEEVSSEMFQLNLQVIDSKMPDILAALLKYYYSGKGPKTNELLELMKNENPCNFNSSLGHNFYEYKVKNFMRDIALGMTPSKMWGGQFDGGYKVVNKDGEILYYHVYNDNEFQDYLLNNTRFETPSSSIGEIYQIDDQYFINLNLEIHLV